MLAQFPDWSGVFRASPYQSPIKRKRHRRSGDTEIDLNLGRHSKRPHTEGPGGTNLGSNATDKYRTHEEKGDQSTQDLIDTNAVVDAAVFVEHIAEDGVVEDEDSDGPAGNGDEDIQFTEQPGLEGLGLEELKQRIRFETEVVKFRCPLCLKLYSDYDAVVRHLKTVHKKGLDWWTCPRRECGYTTDRSSSFRRHIESPRFIQCLETVLAELGAESLPKLWDTSAYHI